MTKYVAISLTILMCIGGCGTQQPNTTNSCKPDRHFLVADNSNFKEHRGGEFIARIIQPGMISSASRF